MQLLIYPVTVFCLAMREMQVFSHMYTESWKQHLLWSVKTLFWGRVGGVSAYINGNTCYSTLFPLFFFFFEFWLVVGCAICQIGCLLMFYFSWLTKDSRLRKLLIINSPKCLWWLLTHARKSIAYFSKYQNKTKSHYHSLLADELLISWGC